MLYFRENTCEEQTHITLSIGLCIDYVYYNYMYTVLSLDHSKISAYDDAVVPGMTLSKPVSSRDMPRALYSYRRYLTVLTIAIVIHC